MSPTASPPSPATASATPHLLTRLQALADERRLGIVEALRGGERCVCDLQDVVGAGQSLLSHHLRVLREAGLVSDRRDGRWVHYSLVPGALSDLEGYLGELREDAASAPRGIRRCP